MLNKFIVTFNGRARNTTGGFHEIKQPICLPVSTVEETREILSQDLLPIGNEWEVFQIQSIERVPNKFQVIFWGRKNGTQGRFEKIQIEINSLCDSAQQLGYHLDDRNSVETKSILSSYEIGGWDVVQQMD